MATMVSHSRSASARMQHQVNWRASIGDRDFLVKGQWPLALVCTPALPLVLSVWVDDGMTVVMLMWVLLVIRWTSRT
jgi:hypothetical protein